MSMSMNLHRALPQGFSRSEPAARMFGYLSRPGGFAVVNLILPMEEVPAPLADYPVVIRLPIQWGDLDAFGHVNNTVPIRWFESSRIAYLDHSQLAHLMTAGGLGPILVSVACNYRKQLHFPGDVLVGGRIGKIGRTSLTMEHAVYSLADSTVAADGSCVVVVFDYANSRPVRLPAEVRAAVSRTEGRE